MPSCDRLSFDSLRAQWASVRLQRIFSQAPAGNAHRSGSLSEVKSLRPEGDGEGQRHKAGLKLNLTLIVWA
jgi:hypothetical protein